MDIRRGNKSMKHNPNYYPLTEFDAVRELVGGSICYAGRTKEFIFRDGQTMPPQNEIDAKFETSPTFNKIKDDPPRKRGI